MWEQRGSRLWSLSPGSALPVGFSAGENQVKCPITQSSEKGLASQDAQENEAALPGPEIVWFISF